MRHHSIVVILYFLLLAILVGGLKALGINAGMQSILAAMAIAGIIMLIGWLVTSAIRRKMANYGLSGKQWAAVAFGHAPNIVGVVESTAYTEETSGGRELVTQPYDMHPVLYAEEEEQDLPDTIIEPNGLHFSDDFQPNIESVLGAMVLLTGIRRSGKSNALAVIAEELARYQVPILICDTEDEYTGLAHPRYMPHARMAGSPDLLRVNPELRSHFIAVDEQGAVDFGKALLEDGLQVVLNLKSYESDDEAARVMCGVIEGMNAWQEARPNRERIPCMVMLDEASKWLPQNLGESYVSKEALALLHQTFFGTLVRRGGKRGFGLVVAAQRIVELDKRCLQSLWKLLFKQTEEIDIARYVRQGLTREGVLSLVPGACFVFSPQVLGFPCQMRARHSPHLAHTPGLVELQQHAARTTHRTERHRSFATAVLPQEDEAFIQRATAALYRNPDGSARLTPLPIVAPIVPEKSTRAEDISLARAIHAWNNGVNTISKLEQVWGLTNHQARRLREMVLEQAEANRPENEEHEGK